MQTFQKEHKDFCSLGLTGVQLEASSGHSTHQDGERPCSPLIGTGKRGLARPLLGSESRLRHIGIPSVLTPRHGKREDRRVEPCVDPTTMPTTSSLVRRNSESWAVG